MFYYYFQNSIQSFTNGIKLHYFTIFILYFITAINTAYNTIQQHVTTQSNTFLVKQKQYNTVAIYMTLGGYCTVLYYKCVYLSLYVKAYFFVFLFCFFKQCTGIVGNCILTILLARCRFIYLAILKF